MNHGGDFKPSGLLNADVLKTVNIGFRWKIRNALRRNFLRGVFGLVTAEAFSQMTGVTTVLSDLRANALLIRDEDRPYYERLAEIARHDPDQRIKAEIDKILGRRQSVRYGILSRMLVTDAGVAFLVDDWDSDAQDITTFNFHACGTGTNAEAVGDTALQTEATTITDRVAGTKSQPAANQLRSVGTQSFTGAGAITEHGLFSVITEGAGSLWDRSVFAAINVGSGDSIQWTYTATINSGG